MGGRCRPSPDCWAMRAERLCAVVSGVCSHTILTPLSVSEPEVGLLSLSLSLSSLPSTSPSSTESCTGLGGTGVLGVGGTMSVALGLNLFGSPAALSEAEVPRIIASSKDARSSRRKHAVRSSGTSPSSRGPSRRRRRRYFSTSHSCNSTAPGQNSP